MSISIHRPIDHSLTKDGFCIVYWDWLKYIVEFLKGKKCLEIMAGCGVLSYSLQQSGINVIPTDNFQFKGLWNEGKKYWTHIEDIDCVEAIRKYGKDVDVIIVSYPSIRGITNESLQCMRDINPDCVMLVICQEKGGITANDLFYDSLISVENDLVKMANDNYIGLGKDMIILIR